MLPGGLPYRMIWLGYFIGDSQTVSVSGATQLYKKGILQSLPGVQGQQDWLLRFSRSLMGEGLEGSLIISIQSSFTLLFLFPAQTIYLQQCCFPNIQSILGSFIPDSRSPFLYLPEVGQTPRRAGQGGRDS